MKWRLEGRGLERLARYLPSAGLTAAIICALLAWTYSEFNRLHHDLKEAEVRANQLTGYLSESVQWDEVMAAAAVRGAQTLAPEYKHRYQETVPLLDSALKKSRELSPFLVERFLDGTERQEDILIEHESLAWKLVEKGDSAGAQRTLSTPAYLSAKKEYRRALQLLAEDVRASEERIRDDLERRGRGSVMAGFGAAVILLALVYLLTKAWTSRHQAEGQLRAHMEHTREELERMVEERTAELEAQQVQILESEEAFRALFERSSDPILLIKGRVFVRCNQAAVSLLGLEKGQSLVNVSPDRISPPFQPCGTASVLKAEAMIRLALEKGFHRFEWVHVKADGSPVHVEVMLTPMKVHGDEILHVAWRDIAARKKAEAEIARYTHQLEEMNLALEVLASADPLTGLSNRRRFLAEVVEKAGEEHASAVLFVDLDNFKLVNDSLGHEAGDSLLIQVAQALRRCCGESAALGRLGGDEFAVLLPGPVTVEEAQSYADRLLKALDGPFLVSGKPLSPTCSIGVATSLLLTAKDPEKRAEELLRNADTAMYCAKKEGKAAWRTFLPYMLEEVQARVALEADLRRAWAQGGLEVHFQPIVNTATGAPQMLEALLRWNCPKRGWVSPSEFIPVAEETGLIEGLGAWCLEEACLSLKDWSSRMKLPHDLMVTVNVSSRQLRRKTFANEVRAILVKTGVRPEKLVLEVTETILASDGGQAFETLKALRAMGVKAGMDDFGTGYSSMSALAHLPVDIVKIDQSFVQSLGARREAAAILRALVTLCEALNLEVIAEGIETEEQLTQAAFLGCGMAQGYLFSRPAPLANLAPWLRDRTALPAA